MKVNDKSSNQVFLAFRGTTNTLGWIGNLCARPCDFYGKIKAHEGMWSQLLSEIATIRASLEKAAAKMDGKPELIVTGHSLGGGFALLMGMQYLIAEFESNFPEGQAREGHVHRLIEHFEERKVVTFGAPSIFQKVLAISESSDRSWVGGSSRPSVDKESKLDEALDRGVHCFVNKNDVVPRILGECLVMKISRWKFWICAQ